VLPLQSFGLTSHKTSTNHGQDVLTAATMSSLKVISKHGFANSKPAFVTTSATATARLFTRNTAQLFGKTLDQTALHA
jgi:hypothetical protein